MVFTREDASTFDEQVKALSINCNIHYRSCAVSLIYILFKRAYLCFVVHKLEKFSFNPGKEHFEGLVYLLQYIRDNNNLGLKYYTKRKDVPLSDLLRQSAIKSENQLLVFLD